MATTAASNAIPRSEIPAVFPTSTAAAAKRTGMPNLAAQYLRIADGLRYPAWLRSVRGPVRSPVTRATISSSVACSSAFPENRNRDAQSVHHPVDPEDPPASPAARTAWNRRGRDSFLLSDHQKRASAPRDAARK